MAPSHPHKTKTAAALRLPDAVTSPTDLIRLTRELESVNDYLYQEGVRHKNGPVKLPKTSRNLDDLIHVNKLDALDAADRKKLQAFLQVLHEKAPVLHISFSVDPSSAFVVKIVAWLRQNVSPFVLVHIGRQPTIGGGCVVRTTNRQFDFGFRQYLSAHKDLLTDSLAKAAES